MVDITVTHAYTTTQGDPPPSHAALVGQSRWNAAHVIQMSDIGLVGRSDAGIGPAAGIIVGAGLLLAASTLSVGANIQQGADIDPGVNVITINMPDSSLYGPFTLVGHSRTGGPDGRLQSQAAWGFNVGPNCYPLIPNQPAMRMAMANHFNSTSDPLTASMEMNFGFFKPTADIEFIPCFGVDYSYNKVGPFTGGNPQTAWGLWGDRINFFDTVGGNNHLAILSNGPNSIDGALYAFGVGSSLSFNKNGVPVARQINAAGNAYLNLPYIDSANRLAIEQASVINGMLVYAPVGSGPGQNTFIGANVGGFLTLTTAHGNTAIGWSALGALTTGTINTAIGLVALAAIQDGSGNIGIGSSALQSLVSGGACIGIGGSVLLNYVGAGPNVAIGFASLFELTTGINNAAYGYNSGRGITTGSANTILGSNVSGLASNLSNSIILADGAGNIRLDWGKTSASTWTMAGSLVVASTINGMTVSTFAGTTPGSGFNTFVGSGAGNATLSTAAFNTVFGALSLASLTTGSFNTAIGCSVLPSLTTGGSNTAIGEGALTSAVASSTCIAVGVGAMSNYTGAGPNTVVGTSSMTSLTTGTQNVVFGHANNGITTGSSNTIIGGNVTGLSATLAAAIVIADGGGNIRLDFNKSTSLGWTIPIATASTSTTTGALVVAGGLGVSGAIYAGTLNVTIGSQIHIADAGLTHGLQLIGQSGADNIVGSIGASEDLVLRTNSVARIRITDTLAVFGAAAAATSAFPALKRSGTTIQVRLADDSDWAPLGTGKITANDATSASLTANCTTAGQQSLHVMQDAGTNIWAVLKNTDNSFNIFDYVNGVNCISISNGTKIIGFAYQTVFGAGTTTRSPIHMNSGVAPASPNNGDIWFDGTNLKMQLGGVTKTFTLT